MLLPMLSAFHEQVSQVGCFLEYAAVNMVMFITEINLKI